MRTKNSTKRIAALTLAIITAAGLAGCAGPSNNAGGSADPASAKVALISSQSEGDPFGDLVFSGLQKLHDEDGTEVRQVAGVEPGAYEQQVRAMVQQGFNPVMVLWDDLGNVVSKLAPDFPDTKFMIIDSYIDPGLDNVETVIIDPVQAAYLAGVYGGSVTQSGVLGFVGGAEQPVIQKYLCGFDAGVKSVRPDASILTSYAGSFQDPTKGEQLADSQIGQGADVLMHAANQTGLGVLQATAAAGKTGIGVDFWQGDVAPGSVGWSALKDAGTATYEAAKAAVDGDFQSGVFVWGAEQGATLFDQRDLDGLPDNLKPVLQSAIDALQSGSVTTSC